MLVQQKQAKGIHNHQVSSAEDPWRNLCSEDKDKFTHEATEKNDQLCERIMRTFQLI